MLEHLHIISFALGAALMWLILVGIHKKNIQSLESKAVKSLEELGAHAKSQIQDLANSIVNTLKK